MFGRGIMLGLGCLGTLAASPVSARPAAPRPPAVKTIGVATMMADGTIRLDLSNDADGNIIEARVLYPPNDPNYAVVRRHLPRLKPGGTVPIPPFPDR